jgi:lysophospholipase L1-like esterase
LVATCLLVGCGSQSPPGDEASAGSGSAASAGGGSTGTGAVTSNGGAISGGATSTGGAGVAGAPAGGAGTGDAGASAIGGALGIAGMGSVGGVVSIGGAGGGGGAGGVPSAGAVGSGGTVDPASLPSVTLHLAGDSTVMTYAADSAQEGWGQELHQYFSTKLTINNQALGGASVETFYGGRWKNIVTALHAGDYVMAAFGANDSGTVAGRHVDPPDFQSRFGVMADEVKAKQATFIVVTPSALQQWVNGKETNTRLEPYVSVLHALAESKPLPLVDLNARSLELLNRVGQDAAQAIYIDGDKAHFTKQGATQMAELVVLELARIASPLAAYRK